MNDDIIVRTIDMPICIKGVTVPDTDGTYNIYINAQYSAEMQNDILKHELRHVQNSDFDNFDSIKTIEDRAKNEVNINLFRSK